MARAEIHRSSGLTDEELAREGGVGAGAADSVASDTTTNQGHWNVWHHTTRNAVAGLHIPSPLAFTARTYHRYVCPAIRSVGGVQSRLATVARYSPRPPGRQVVHPHLVRRRPPIPVQVNVGRVVPHVPDRPGSASAGRAPPLASVLHFPWPERVQRPAPARCTSARSTRSAGGAQLVR